MQFIFEPVMTYYVYILKSEKDLRFFPPGDHPPAGGNLWKEREWKFLARPGSGL
jgi:hypothetical protein